MTRDRARRILQKLEGGMLSTLERNELVTEVAGFILRAALSSADGRVTFELDDAAPRFSPTPITHEQE